MVGTLSNAGINCMHLVRFSQFIFFPGFSNIFYETQFLIYIYTQRGGILCTEKTICILGGEKGGNVLLWRNTFSPLKFVTKMLQLCERSFNLRKDSPWTSLPTLFPSWWWSSSDRLYFGQFYFGNNLFSTCSILVKRPPPEVVEVKVLRSASWSEKI